MNEWQAIDDRRRGKQEETPPREIKLIPFGEIELDDELEYLVHGLIPRDGLTVAWGPPKCSKSFIIYDLMMHVALGRQYRGRHVEQGAVVYCAFEGGRGFKKRVAAFRQRFLKDHAEPVPFYLQPIRLDLIADATRSSPRSRRSSATLSRPRSRSTRSIDRSSDPKAKTKI